VRTGKLNVKRVESIIAGRDKEPKRYYGDGGGLWLVVTLPDRHARSKLGIQRSRDVALLLPATAFSRLRIGAPELIRVTTR